MGRFQLSKSGRVFYCRLSLIYCTVHASFTLLRKGSCSATQDAPRALSIS